MMYDLYEGCYISAREAGAYIPRDMWETEGVVPRREPSARRGSGEMMHFDDLLELYPELAHEIQEGDVDMYEAMERHRIEPQAR